MVARSFKPWHFAFDQLGERRENSHTYPTLYRALKRCFIFIAQFCRCKSIFVNAHQTREEERLFWVFSRDFQRYGIWNLNTLASLCRVKMINLEYIYL